MANKKSKAAISSNIGELMRRPTKAKQTPVKPPPPPKARRTK